MDSPLNKPLQKKVLIIEDDTLLAKLYIKEFGTTYSSILAEDGEKGLQFALSEKPDLIVLDIALPKMQGTEMMKRLRSDPWGAKVPIIIVTNLTIDDTILRDVVEGQPSYVLTKSDTTPGDILNKINQILMKQAPQQQQ